MAFSLEGQDVFTKQLSLERTDQPLVTYKPGVLDERTFRAMFAMERTGVEEPVYRSAIGNGDEAALRERDMQEVFNRRRAENEGIIADFARRKEGPVSPEEEAILLDLANAQRDPNGYKRIWEEEYAKKILSYSTTPADVAEAASEDFNTVANSDIAATEFMMKQEYAINKLQELNSEVGDRWNINPVNPSIPIPFQTYSMLPDELRDWVEQFTPGFDYVHSLIAAYKSDQGKNVEILFQGDTRENIINELWTLPPGQFEEAFDAYLAEAKKLNHISARDFIDGFLNVTSEGTFFRNIIPFMDAFDVGTIAAGAGTFRFMKNGRKLGPKSERYVKKTGEVVKSHARGDRPEEILESAGEIELAAVVRSIKNRLNESTAVTSGVVTPKAVRADLDNLPTVFDPGTAFKGGGGAPPKWGRRPAQGGSPDFSVTLSSEKIRAVPETALLKGWDQALNSLKDLIWEEKPLNQTFESMAADIRYLREDETSHGAPAVQVVLGSPEGLPLKSPEAAAELAEQLTLKPDAIEQLPNGDYAIVFEQPIQRTDEAVLDKVLLDKETYFEPGAVRRNVRHFQTMLENSSAWDRNVMKTAFHQQQRMVTEVGEPLFGPIAKLNKKSLDRLERVLDNGRRNKKFFNTDAELISKWTRINDTVPTPEEIDAYRAAVNINDLEYKLKETNYLRYKTLQGRKQVGITMPKGKVIDNDGVILGELPDDINIKDYYAVAVIDLDKGTSILSRAEARGKKDYIRQLQDNGYKIIQLGSARYDPLGLGHNVHFAVAKPAHIKNLSARTQIPYNPGGHFNYDAVGYLKFPKIKRGKSSVMYSGDFTAYPFKSEAQGRRWEAKFKEAISMARRGINPDEFILKNLPISPREFRRHVRQGNIDLSPDGPMPAFVKQGSTVWESSSEFKKWANSRKDFINNRHNHWDIDNPLAREDERNEQLAKILETVDEQGTARYELAPADMLNPLVGAEKALSSAIRRNTLEKGVESAAVHFTELLIAATDEPAAKLRADPFRTMMEWTPDKLSKLDDKVLAGKLRMMKLSAENLLNQNVPMQNVWNDFMSSVAAKLDTEANTGIRKRLLNSVEMAKTTDFPRFMRSAAFHLKLGLGNVAQIGVQSQTFWVMAAIQPRDFHAMLGGAYPLRLALLNPNNSIKRGLAKFANKVGKNAFKPGEFEEIVDLIRETGWQYIKGTHSYIDNAGDPRIVRNSPTKVLDHAAVFFNEIEMSLRMGAYIGAYRWMRRQLPAGAKLTLKHKDMILQRAGDLSVNMTREASANWQRGAFTLTSQFYGYMARLTDLAWGTRLTGMEKARLIASQSLLYGVPLGATIGIPVYAFRDAAKDWINSHPELRDSIDDAGLTAIAKTVEDGLLQSVSGVFGYELGVADRLGPAHIPIFQDILFNPDDKTVPEMLGGASLTIGLDAMSRLEPFIWMTKGLFNGEEFPLDYKDFGEALAPVSSLSQAARGYIAWTTGEFLATKGNKIGTVDEVEAMIFSISGVQPQRFHDIQSIRRILKGEEDAKKALRPRISEEWRDMLKAANDGNKAEVQKHLKRMFVYARAGGFDGKELKQIQRFSTKNTEGLQEQMLKKFFLDAPTNADRDFIDFLNMLRRGDRG